MWSIFVTSEVSKLFKSNSFNNRAPENMYDISFTLLVLKLVNFNEFNILQ